MANFGKEGKPEPVITKFSQETLADIVGTTRSRVSTFVFSHQDGPMFPPNQQRLLN
jgi:hypothetical protein